MYISNKNYILYIKLITWINDFEGVFDHKSTALKKINMYINEAAYIVRTNDNYIKNVEQHSDIKMNLGEELLFNINNGRNDCYKFINPIPHNMKLTEENIKYLDKKLWYVLKSDDIDKKNVNNDYYLCENDIIKLGCLKYAVQEINLQTNSHIYNEKEPPNIIPDYDISLLNKNCPPVFDFIYEVKNYYNFIDLNKIIVGPNQGDTPQSDHQEKCKICSSIISTNGKNDPLISLCACKELIHYKCLKKLINEKTSIENQNNFVKSINISEFECEKCKTQLPLRFKLSKINKIFYLIDIKKPIKCDYIILESLNYRKNDKYAKSIHIISLLKDYILIGRDNENDLIETESSISRKQAVLKYNKENGNIILENRSTKFGTLVLVKNPIQILEKKIQLQVGRTIIEANIMKMEEFEKLKNQNYINKESQNIKEQK